MCTPVLLTVVATSSRACARPSSGTSRFLPPRMTGSIMSRYSPKRRRRRRTGRDCQSPRTPTQPVQPAGQEPGPPFGHRVAADAQPAATAMLLCPSALASTIRARNARSCAVLRRFAQFSNVCCSSCDNTSGASTGSPILPAHCTPAALSSSNQSAEAKGDSSGDRELKTGTLDVSEHRTLPAPGTTISGTLHLTAAIDVPS